MCPETPKRKTLEYLQDLWVVNVFLILIELSGVKIQPLLMTGPRLYTGGVQRICMSRCQMRISDGIAKSADLCSVGSIFALQ